MDGTPKDTEGRVWEVGGKGGRGGRFRLGLVALGERGEKRENWKVILY